MNIAKKINKKIKNYKFVVIKAIIIIKNSIITKISYYAVLKKLIKEILRHSQFKVIVA